MTAGVRARRGAGRGPYDEDDLDPGRPDGVQRIDFGALRLPVPPGAVVDVEPSQKGKLQAVHMTLPQGRLSVSALAVPTSGRLWPELAKEIHTSLRDAGARVRWFDGRWGRELRARTGEAFSVFVGIDGPRWMLYGVATAPLAGVRALDRELRRVLGETVVVRGTSPYPVRTVLPLVLPEDLQAEQDARRERQAVAARALEAQAAQAAERAAAERAAAERAAAERAATQAAAAQASAARIGVEPDDPPTEEFPVVPLPHGSRTTSGAAGQDVRAGRDVRDLGPAAPARPIDGPTTELAAIARPPVTTAGPGWSSARPEPVEPDPRWPAEPEPDPSGWGERWAQDEPETTRADAPAMAWLLGDPMDLFRAASPGRHRRDD